MTRSSTARFTPSGVSSSAARGEGISAPPCPSPLPLTIPGVLKEMRRLVAQGIEPPIAARKALPDTDSLKREERDQAIYDGCLAAFHQAESEGRWVENHVASDLRADPRPSVPQPRLDFRSAFANLNYDVAGTRKNIMAWTHSDRVWIRDRNYAVKVGAEKRIAFIDWLDKHCKRNGVDVVGDLSDEALRSVYERYRKLQRKVA